MEMKWFSSSFKWMRLSWRSTTAISSLVMFFHRKSHSSHFWHFEQDFNGLTPKSSAMRKSGMVNCLVRWIDTWGTWSSTAWLTLPRSVSPPLFSITEFIMVLALGVRDCSQVVMLGWVPETTQPWPNLDSDRRRPSIWQPSLAKPPAGWRNW